jgi:hypothetical protein
MENLADYQVDITPGHITPTMSNELIAPKTGIPLPGYLHLHVPIWIPTLPKLGSILGFSQRLLWPFSPIAIKAKNNRLS